MSGIHPAAHVDSESIIGKNVAVGPGAVIGAGVELGEDCEIGAHAVLEGPAVIGAGCRIFPGAVVGTEAQMVALEVRGGGVEIGPGTVIREMVTIHRSIHEDKVTRIGEECYLMTQAHVAHDCLLGDRVILANWIGLSGHVEVGNDSFISGYVGIHQFVRVGEGVMLTGPNAVRKDVPPFATVDGNPPRVRGLNMVGLRRRGVSAEVRGHLKRAYQLLAHETKSIAEGVARIEAELPLGREIKSVIEFAKASKRGIYLGDV